jgi:hypothetical protein
VERFNVKSLLAEEFRQESSQLGVVIDDEQSSPHLSGTMTKGPEAINRHAFYKDIIAANPPPSRKVSFCKETSR